MSEQQALEPAQPNQELAYLQFLERAASDSTVDVDKLERIMAMHKEMLQMKAQSAYTVAMAKAQAEMPPVACDKENKHTKSRYPSIEAVQKAIKKIYLDNGFTCIFSEGDAPTNGMIHVIATVRHTGGHVEVFHRYAPADTAGPSGTKNKTEVQGSQSTVSYISRRLLCSIFGVSIVGDDQDGNAAYEKITATQVADLRTLAEEVGADIPKFCQYFKIDTIENLPVSLYESAVKAFEKKRKSA